MDWYQRSLTKCRRGTVLVATLILIHASFCNKFAVANATNTSCAIDVGSRSIDAETAQFTVTNGNIEMIDLGICKSFGPNDSESFQEDWQKAFPVNSSPLFSYSVKDDPEKALAAVHDAYAFVVKWLPSTVLAKLASFPFTKSGPSALLIRGLPIDTAIPPTPTKATVFEDSADRNTENPESALVPVAETWLLGISRVLGVPTAAPFSTGVDRGGLVRDITQTPGDDGDLPMHRDYPSSALDPKHGIVEPEIFILFGVRSDAAGGDTENGAQAQTVVTDSEKLIQAMDVSDAALLRSTTVKTELKLPNGDYIPISKEFHPIVDNEDGTTTVTLHNLPNARYTSPDGGAATVAAYERVSQLAFDMGERVDLGPGDMLIIQNSRLVHGRTKFHSDETCCDGTGRWLVKSYVSNRLWHIPGRSNSGHIDFPNLNPMPWKEPS